MSMTKTRFLAALLAALLVAFMTTLGVAPPAQALGWSSQRCAVNSTGNFKACAQAYTVDPDGPGIRTTRFRLCVYANAAGVTHKGTKEGDWYVKGSNGTTKGVGPLLSVQDGSNCRDTEVYVNHGGDACFHLMGTVIRPYASDEFFDVDGANTGGACSFNI